MKYYLSSYKFGNKVEKLRSFVPVNKIGYIANARDFTGADPERRIKNTEEEIHTLRDLGLEVAEIDLSQYFGKQEELKRKINEIGAVFISGGNVFVLRQAMRLSGLEHPAGIFKLFQSVFVFNW